MIDSKDIEICKSRLTKLGFEKQPGGEMNHGQVFGLRYKITKRLQLHFKVMPDGRIESELEPPPEYPGAHLNQKHSFSPHKELNLLLKKIKIRYRMRTPIPETCNYPEENEPDRPLLWQKILLIGIVPLVTTYIAYKIAKSDS